ncbi:MAG: exodeoxyribonuclease VII small subunit [bacterium]
MSKKNQTFEQSLIRLQEISTLLESEEVSLDESIKLYEEGILLSKICYSKLNEAELKITELKNQLETGISEETDEE